MTFGAAARCTPLLVLVLLALTGCGGGSGGGDETRITSPAPTPVAQGDRSSPQTPSRSGGEKAKAQKTHEAPREERAKGAAGHVRRDDGASRSHEEQQKQHRSPAHTQTKAQPEAGGGCPSGVSAGECKEAADALQGDDHSGSGSPEECPAGVSSSECREAADAVEANHQENGSAETCPPGLSATECRELAESLGR